MFVAEHVALEVVKSLGTLLPSLERRDRDLARQIRRAGSSILLNIADGKGRQGRDRVQHYRIAAGSGHEVRAALQTAIAWGYVSDDQCAACLALLDRELGLLWGLTERKRPPSSRAVVSAKA